MRRSSFLVLSLGLAGCTHALDDHAPSAAASSSASTQTIVALAPKIDAPLDAPEESPETPFAEARKGFEKVKETLLGSYYDPKVGEDALYRAATRGMLEHADPKMRRWNKLLPPNELADLLSDLKGEIVGVGARIDFDPTSGYSDVLGTIAGSPAEKAGLLAGDTIVTIDGKLYKGKTLHDVLGDIRGKAGEIVVFSVLRGDKLVSISIARGVVPIETVGELSLGDKLGYVHVHAFNETTIPLLEKALGEITRRGDVGVVVDLRDNQGGAFDGAVAAADRMIPAGSTIVTVDKRGGPEPRLAKGPPLLDPAIPTVVLVSHDTASGAELLTAALRFGRHAIVVGAPTLGKWTVQTIDEIGNGYAFKYTIGVFRAPNGEAYEGVGLTPDLEVDLDASTITRALATSDLSTRLTIDTQLKTAISLLRTH